MVYLIGASNREYTIAGITIPKKAYNAREIELGKRTFIGISETDYARISGQAIFKDLVRQGVVLVHDRAPEGSETLPELRTKLEQGDKEHKEAINVLQARIQELEDSNKTATSRVAELQAAGEKIIAEAQEQIGLRDKQIQKLEQQLADYEETYK